MYTKIFLLIAISIIVSSSISIDFGHFKTSIHIEKTSDNNLAPTPDKPINPNLPLGIDWSDIPHQDNNNHSHQNSDDDGKSHHFHFDHFSTHRRRIILFHAFAKLILLVSFISSFISSFYMWHC